MLHLKKYINHKPSSLTQNFTKKKDACGPLSKRSRKPPRFSGNLSDICRISTACNIDIRTINKIVGMPSKNIKCGSKSFI